MSTTVNMLLDKLRSVEARYDEMTVQLADPAVVSDSKKYQKTAKAHAELGELVSKFRLGGNYSASPLYAGKWLYFCDEEGHTKLVEPNDKPRVIASNRLDGSLKASPAVLEHAIILRTDKALYRIEE